MTRVTKRHRASLILGALLLVAASQATAEVSPGSVGLKMYRDGLRPSGEPLTAVVGGDVELLGTQFSCQSCHGRSGMGAAEGNIIVPAIVGDILFAPLVQPERPAYDEQSLARLLRDGIDAAGREVDPLMPRFRLTNEEVRALRVYLERLTTVASPGVDATTMRIATVVTDEVPTDAREAVLEVLRTFVDERNRQTRLESRRPDRGNAPESRLPSAYREWQFEVWNLDGPESSYREQLRDYYESGPVFAIVGGVTAGSWEPIGKFCEHLGIPCLFPSTPWPAGHGGEVYSMHFSRGLELEADLVAMHLAAEPVVDVVQYYCDALGARAAAALSKRLADSEMRMHDVAFDCDRGPSQPPSTTARSGSAVVLWTGPAAAGYFAALAPDVRRYASSTLLGDIAGDALPAALGDAFVAHPFLLPDSRDAALLRFRAWARSRGIEVTHPRLQSEAFFACMAANDALSHLGRFFVRDFALDMLDHAQGLVAFVPNYPRPSLGPGQRFLSKGGYILPVKAQRTQNEAAVWILP